MGLGEGVVMICLFDKEDKNGEFFFFLKYMHFNKVL